MTEPTEALSQYLLFDLNGQQVAVTDVQIDSKGLKTSWVVLGKRLYTDEQTDEMLQQAFGFLFQNIDQPIQEPDPEPEPVKLSYWSRMRNYFREFL